MLRTRGLIALAALSWFPTISSAEESIDLWRPGWRCGSPLHLMGNHSRYLEVRYTFRAEEKLPSFVIGSLSKQDEALPIASDRPLLLFTKIDDQWRIYPVEAAAGVYGVYLSPSSGRVVFFAMHDRGGPGESYTVVSTIDGFKSVRCGVLKMPDVARGSTDYMHITSFAGDDTGKLKVEGVINFASETPEMWFGATSEDGGKSWSTPKRLARTPMYSIPDNMIDDELLVNDLMASLLRK
jgi:hypothetical protein